mmetsp:Transcript_1140/g.2695  ORF Transcript_1140/g.2695 Transcript_1140/m.2695 type:complete len:102 (-) Transcript_1140:1265-1570(-)
MLPNAFPDVSGKCLTITDVATPTENMTIPMTLSEVFLDTIKGHVIPPTRPIALASPCPVARKRVGKSSAVCSQVTLDAPIMNIRDKNAKTNKHNLFMNLLS